MKVTEYINKSQKTHLSLEILPPLKGENLKMLFEGLQPLVDFNPAFIDVTYHREDVYYQTLDNGLLQKKIVRRRPGTVGICAAIQSQFGIDAVPHILCGGFNKEETENLLIDLDFIGIENVMALRGDPLKSDTSFIPTEKGHRYAKNLVEQIVDLNSGRYLDSKVELKSPTNFCIGISGYPEKHAESPNLNFDLKIVQQKIAAGADYIVTQMFFDNAHFLNFVKTCRDAGIKVPIIPGLKPITSKLQLHSLPMHFALDIPEDLNQSVSKCQNNAAVKQVGIEWCIQQSRELLSHKVPLIHYYTMSRADNIFNIVKTIF